MMSQANAAEPTSVPQEEPTVATQELRDPGSRVPMPLTLSRRAELRSEAHHLEPVVQVGAQGLTPALFSALEDVLDLHGLIKVRLGPGFVDDRHQAAQTLSTSSGASLVQLIGRVVVLYREPVPRAPASKPTPRSPKGNRDMKRRGRERRR